VAPLVGPADRAAAQHGEDGPDEHGPGAIPDARPGPYLLAAGVAALLVPLAAAVGPLRDIDVYWHLRLGQEIASGIPVTEAGRGWSFAPVPDTWVSSQWIFEVILSRLEQIGGLPAVLLVRVVTAAVALTTLAWATLRRSARAGVWPFLLGAVALTMVTQERSQQLTFILAPLVGLWAERLWRKGSLPAWWWVLPLVVVWSNWHGGWVLLPALLALASLARALDHGLRDRAILKALFLALACTAAACISPSGVSNALAVARFSESTPAIMEWKRLTFDDLLGIPLEVLLLVIVICWARGRARPSRGELVLVLAMAVFAAAAVRNAAPATLMLAPIATGILARALGTPDPVPIALRTPMARTAVALGVVGLLLGVVAAPLQASVVDPAVPQKLLAVLRDAPSGQRVLNAYDASGAVLWFAGPSPHVTVAIDGRADRYGGAYIARHLALEAARPGWSTMLDELQPTSALLRTADALPEVLVAQRGWVEVGREGGWVLLRAPGTQLPAP
jgi:hypothetical protein